MSVNCRQDVLIILTEKIVKDEPMINADHRNGLSLTILKKIGYNYSKYTQKNVYEILQHFLVEFFAQIVIIRLKRLHNLNLKGVTFKVPFQNFTRNSLWEPKSSRSFTQGLSRVIT